MLLLALQTAALLLAAYLLGAYCGSRLYRLFISPDLDADLAGSAVAIPEQPFIELETGPQPPAPNLAVANRFERALLGTRLREGPASRLVVSQLASVGNEPERDPEPVTPTASFEPIQATEATEAIEIIEVIEPAEAIEPRDPVSRMETTEISDTFEPIEPTPTVDRSETADTKATRVMMKEPSCVEPALGEPTPMSNDQAPAPSLPAASSTGGLTGASAPLAISSQQSADDLTRIYAIDPATAAQLADLGVSSYARLAAFRRVDVDRIGATIERSRISREGWIEQAQLLANGRETAFSRQITGNSESAFLVPSPPVCSEAQVAATALSPGEPASRLEIEVATAPDAQEDAATLPDRAEFPILEAQPAAAEPGFLAEAPDEPNVNEGDDLTLIRGIDAKASEILRANGVTTFRHIADWRSSEVRDFEALLGLPGQSRRHNWQKQARRLIKRATAGGSSQKDDVALSQPGLAASLEQESPGSAMSAIVPPAGYEKEAEHGLAEGNPEIVGDQAFASGAAGSSLDAAVGEASNDDLKRIRGIGLLIEKKLNSLGICRYEQIANWTAAEIDRISQMLDFKGRIEREAWVEQARILVSGGQTEFSNRIDRE